MGINNLQNQIAKNSLILISYYVIIMMYQTIFNSIGLFEYIFGTSIITNLLFGLIGALKQKPGLMMLYQIFDLLYVLLLLIVAFYTAINFIGCLFNDICKIFGEEPVDMWTIIIHSLIVFISIYVYFLHIKTIIASMNLTRKITKKRSKKNRKVRKHSSKKKVNREQKIEEGHVDCANDDNGEDAPLIMMQPIAETNGYYPQLSHNDSQPPPSFNPGFIPTSEQYETPQVYVPLDQLDNQESQDEVMARELQEQYNQE